MFRIVKGLIDRIFVVIGAVLFAQAPQFFNSYGQRLGGHMAELQRQISALQQAADRSGKGLAEYIHKFVNHSDPDVAMQGDFMQSMVARYSEISNAYLSLINADPWLRPFQFIYHLQPDITRMTLSDFQPGLSLTPESGIYALIGMGFGYLLYLGIRAILRIPLGIRKLSHR